MEAHEAAFAFMNGAIRVEIPFFQRGYVWNKDNWRDLIEDLLDDKSSHFLGSIILKSIKTASGEIPRWSLIDGQQRLTTLSSSDEGLVESRIPSSAEVDSFSIISSAREGRYVLLSRLSLTAMSRRCPFCGRSVAPYPCHSEQARRARRRIFTRPRSQSPSGSFDSASLRSG